MSHSTSGSHHCLNCGVAVQGNYCSNCGQSTHVHRESFGHILSHFVADYFHYDSKFLRTIRYLLFRPGYLTRQYIGGKRASFLGPVQLYFFISAISFLIFFSLFHTSVSEQDRDFEIIYHVGLHMPRDRYAHTDTTVLDGYKFGTKEFVAKADSQFSAYPASFSLDYLLDKGFNSMAHYTYKKHITTFSDGLTAVLQTFVKSIPKLFFVLMPLFALLLKLFFGKKNVFFVDHAVMSLHFHSFLFIGFSLSILLYLIPGASNNFPIWFLLTVATIYFFVAAHVLYRRHWLYTLFVGAFTWSLYLFLILAVGVINLFLVMKFA